MGLKKHISYLVKITDKIGVIEHCRGDNADYDEGYCVDDNARALQVCLRLKSKYPILKKFFPIYFSFLKSAFDGKKLYNDFDKKNFWKVIRTTNGEHYGRLMAALGELINQEKNRDDSLFFDQLYRIFKKNKKQFLRSVSQLICGLRFYKKEDVSFWADFLVKQYLKEKTNEWRWFEPILSYDIGRIPLSLLIAYQVTKNKKYLEVATESLDFLTKITFNKEQDCFVFPGNRGWFTKSGKRKIYDQQPLEAGSITEVYCLAFKITKNKKYKDLALKAFAWYSGKNILKVKMINKKNGGIYDGFNDKKININQGAESVLAYILAAEALESIKKLEE